MTHPDEDLHKRYPMFEIGDGSYGLLSILVWSGSQIRIGKYCSFGAHTLALLGGEHRTDFVSTYPFHMLWGDKVEIARRADIEIGSDVWVGAASVVLGGSKIGHGAVIAAGAVVSGVVAPYAVVGGNPMRLIRWRFNEVVREELLQLRWWDWPSARIQAAMPSIQSSDVAEFIDKANRGEL